MKYRVTIAALGLLLAGCNAAPQGTPADPSDPLAAVCPGATTEALTALRTLYAGFVQNDHPIEDAQAFARQQCESTTGTGDELDACLTCFSAAIDEVYASPVGG